MDSSLCHRRLQCQFLSIYLPCYWSILTEQGIGVHCLEKHGTSFVPTNSIMRMTSSEMPIVLGDMLGGISDIRPWRIAKVDWFTDFITEMEPSC